MLNWRVILQAPPNIHRLPNRFTNHNLKTKIALRIVLKSGSCSLKVLSFGYKHLNFVGQANISSYWCTVQWIEWLRKVWFSRGLPDQSVSVLMIYITQWWINSFRLGLKESILNNWKCKQFSLIHHGEITHQINYSFHQINYLFLGRVIFVTCCVAIFWLTVDIGDVIPAVAYLSRVIHGGSDFQQNFWKLLSYSIYKYFFIILGLNIINNVDI